MFERKVFNHTETMMLEPRYARMMEMSKFLGISLDFISGK